MSITVLVASASRAAPAQPYTLLEAVETALKQHPGIQIQEEQTNIARGVLRQAAAPFDTFVQASINQSRLVTPLTRIESIGEGSNGYLNVHDLTTELTGLSAAVTKLYRNGISITGSSIVDRNTDDITRLSGENRSTTGFVITLPLLAGRGRDVVGAQETQARLESQASLFDLNFQISQHIANAAVSYWNLVAAQHNLSVAIESEKRGSQILESVRALIEADHLPKAEIEGVSANLADRRATRVALEQSLIQAQVQLALDMGLKPDQIATLPEAIDDFPPSELFPEIQELKTRLQLYVSYGLGNRADLKAARRREDEARVARIAAKNLLLPRLDLGIGASYTGLREGVRPDQYLFALLTGGKGPGFVVSLNYASQPRDLAQGQIIQTEAITRQLRLRTIDLERTVEGSVLAAVEAARNSAENIRNAKQSVAAFQSALDGEREKLRLGAGSIVNMLSIEDRLTTALQKLVQAMQTYPQALVQLRFASGTLVSADQRIQRVDVQRLLSPPAPIPAGQGK